MSAARASELQRLRGILLNAPPSSPTLAGAGAASHSVLVPLKGIDVLANGRYRVQLNTFMSGRKKFSRNSTDLYEVRCCPISCCCSLPVTRDGVRWTPSSF
jgi:hypothetical protein